jgi:hypothetical protein
MKSRALVWGLMAENLDALKCGGWGVFIAPTTKMAVGEGCCPIAYRTVRCASHVTRPLGFDRWSFWHVGHRTVLMVHRTGTVHCPVRHLTPSLTLHAQLALFTVLCSRCRRPLVRVAVAPLGTPDSPVLHRTVRWIIVEWLPEFPKLSSWRESTLVHRTLSGAPDQGSLRLLCSFLFEPFLWTLYWFIVNLWHL